jgi:DNA-binding GntR family transcriptional regulator
VSPSPPTIRLLALLDAKLDTFEKLEVVLALHAAGSPLTMTELAVELQVGRDVLRRVAEDVADSGLVEMVEGDAVRMLPTSHDAEIAEAAAIYLVDRSVLLHELSRIAMDRIRGLAARTFADAFRIRRKPKD